MSTAFLTDHYELTMLDSAIADGTAETPVVFEAFARSLPRDHGIGVVAGIGRFLDLLADFRFTAEQLARASEFLRSDTVDHLRRWRFRGDIDAYAEGEVYLPHSPVVTVRTDFGSGLLLETLLLSVLNHDSAVASKALRIVTAAGDVPVIEMGSRRTHEQAAVAAARAARIAGFASSSNLESGMRHRVPTAGTAAHAWTLVHLGDHGETDAFRAQLEVMGENTTLLVDTFDIEQGIRRAVAVANELGHDGPGAIRIDSGDLAEEAERARALLDELGATATRIVVSSDLDEYEIARVRHAPIDGYGVGTRVVTDLTPPGFVYKLVAVQDDSGSYRAVEKDSSGKESHGGWKSGWRTLVDGVATAEVLRPGDGDGPDGARRLDAPAVVDGRRVVHADVDEARETLGRALAELPDGAVLSDVVARDRDRGPSLPTRFEQTRD